MPPCKIEGCPALTWVNSGNPKVVLWAMRSLLGRPIGQLLGRQAPTSALAKSAVP